MKTYRRMHAPSEVTPAPNDRTYKISAYYDMPTDGTMPDSLSYGNLSHDGGGATMFIPAYLGGSDYSGSLVEVSNHRVFADNFKSGQGVWWSDLYGGHGSFGVLVDPARIPSDIVTEVAEFLGALNDYPLADENDHSELETEAQNAAWENDVRADFVRKLETQHECDLTDVSHDAIFDLFRSAEDAANVYWENQSGSDMYIDVDRIVDKVTSDEVRALPGYVASAE